MSDTLPCIVCDKELEPAYGGPDAEENQPSDATAFLTYGHYGSGMFDPMDGSALEVNVCDDCLGVKSTAVLHYPQPVQPRRPSSRPQRLSQWLRTTPEVSE